jgi:hypothetical protein
LEPLFRIGRRIETVGEAPSIGVACVPAVTVLSPEGGHAVDPGADGVVGSHGI